MAFRPPISDSTCQLNDGAGSSVGRHTMQAASVTCNVVVWLTGKFVNGSLSIGSVCVDRACARFRSGFPMCGRQDSRPRSIVSQPWRLPVLMRLMIRRLSMRSRRLVTTRMRSETRGALDGRGR
jgi:hypothetical protein